LATREGRQRELCTLGASRARVEPVGLTNFLVMVLSFTGAAVTVIWTVTLAIGRLKRLAQSANPDVLSSEDLEEIRARLAELEHRELRIEEIEERLDFMERVLGRAQESKKPLPGPADGQ